LQVTFVESEKKAVEQLLLSERQKSQEHIRLLEQQLQRMQDVLVTKMHELSIARDSQLPLKAEIEAFRILLEQEEARYSKCAPQMAAVSIALVTQLDTVGVMSLHVSV